ncbi:MAG: hypothetical protein ACI9QC_000654 [Oceanicoccus sp.]|jgi:hypothetical protein
MSLRERALDVAEIITYVSHEVTENIMEKPDVAILAITDGVSELVFGSAHKQGRRRTALDRILQKK